MNLVSKI